MSFADFVWSRRADWAAGRSAFRPASTRCSRPLASTGSLGMSQLISCVICRLRVLGSSGLPVAFEVVRPRLNSLALPHEVRECHSLFHMSFADFVWSRRADWAAGRSAFRPASTRCSRPLASTGSLGMPQLISCVFRRLRVSYRGRRVIRVSGRGASRVGAWGFACRGVGLRVWWMSGTVKP